MKYNYNLLIPSHLAAASSVGAYFIVTRAYKLTKRTATSLANRVYQLTSLTSSIYLADEIENLITNEALSFGFGAVMYLVVDPKYQSYIWPSSSFIISHVLPLLEE